MLHCVKEMNNRITIRSRAETEKDGTKCECSFWVILILFFCFPTFCKWHTSYKEDSLKDDSKPTSNLKLFFGGIYSIIYNTDIYIEKRFVFNPLLSPPPVKYIYYKLLQENMEEKLLFITSHKNFGGGGRGKHFYWKLVKSILMVSRDTNIFSNYYQFKLEFI